MSRAGKLSPRPGILKQDSIEAESPGSYLGLNQTSSPKSVTIASRPETISPLILGKQKNCDELELDQTSRISRRPIVKQPSARRLSGRPYVASPELKPLTSGQDGSQAPDEKMSTEPEQRQHRHHSKHVDSMVNQISAWIEDEKARRAKRKARKKPAKHTTNRTAKKDFEDKDEAESTSERRGSDASDASDSLSMLESIIARGLSFDVQRSARSSLSLRHRPSLMKMHSRKASTVSEDNDYEEQFFGDEILVPSCEVVLDNSNTMNYPTAITDNSEDSSGDELDRQRSYRDLDAWASFRFEIVRLAHTLRLKGWRKVPLDLSSQVKVERLSGALTNAVYVVTPPAELPPGKAKQDGMTGTVTKFRKPPPQLLLRIYGPQAEHLIDREAELQILRRLARKRIGPRLLGTFANGRFEEYLHAKTLTAEDIRNPDTSRQIAKRMRELHEGIELLDEEREAGAFVWRRWDKSLQRVEQVAPWLDSQIKAQEPGVKPTGDDAWKRRGLICGLEWKDFNAVVVKYRAWLNAQYGGTKKMQEQLVFAHNDTQYGNIMRMVPSGESPLLLPANTHKQLVVIDFEYACANVPGVEFANHFTEWCYDYHDERKPYACHTNRFPTPEEQDRFVRAYVRHRPALAAQTPEVGPSTPSSMAASTPERSRRPTSTIGEFMLDARNPYFPSSAPGTPSSQVNNEQQAKQAEDAEVERLLREAKMWRLANSAQWIAWGIVQAKVPGMPIFSPSQTEEAAQKLDPIAEHAREDLKERADEYKTLAENEQGDEMKHDGMDGQSEADDAKEQEEEFDNLGYAQHRAMFFWGDAIQLGIIKAEDLPEELRAKVKYVLH